MFLDNNIIEIKDHIKNVIEHTTDPKDIEILVNSYKNIICPIIIDSNTSANEKNRVYDGEFDYKLGFENAKKIYLGYIYNELENQRKYWRDNFYKQQKEIEELKERNKELVESIEEWINGERINDIKHISKDKIREKIKELEEKSDYWNCDEIEVLKELLEEN